MLKTKIKKIIATFTVCIITSMNLSIGVFAAQDIGDVIITGGATTDTMWDGFIPGSGSGAGVITVTGHVDPTLTMTVSAANIDLGNLLPAITSTWYVDIEIGTNAIDWVVITASSWSGGLENIVDNSIHINSTNWESYTFESASWVIDSTVSGFAVSNLLATTEITNSNQNTIYQTNRPELNDWANADVVFTVWTTIDDETISGDYSDTITFTVTATF